MGDFTFGEKTIEIYSDQVIVIAITFQELESDLIAHLRLRSNNIFKTINFFPRKKNKKVDLISKFFPKKDEKCGYSYENNCIDLTKQ